MQFEEKEFQYGKVDVHYLSGGKGNPLLFLPGGLKAHTYIHNLTELAKTYQVIAPDLPGFGHSTVPNSSWNLETYAECMEALLKSLSIERIPVVGHSIGGGVGLYLAARSNKVQKMVLFSPVGVAITGSLVGFYLNVLIKKTVNDALQLKNNRFQAFIFNNAISTVLENFLAVPQMMKITNTCVTTAISDVDLKKITIPVLLAWGKNDELFPVRDGVYMKNHIQNAHLDILEGNHDWWTIYPERGAEKVTEFLQKA